MSAHFSRVHCAKRDARQRCSMLPALVVALAFVGCSSAASTTSDVPFNFESCPKTLIENPQLDPTTGMETGAARKVRRELEMVLEITTSAANCGKNAPDFNNKFGTAYRQWERKHQAAILRFSQNLRARRIAECSTEEQRQAAKNTPRGDIVRFCHEMIGPTIEKIIRDGIPE